MLRGLGSVFGYLGEFLPDVIDEFLGRRLGGDCLRRGVVSYRQLGVVVFEVDALGEFVGVGGPVG
jgi:hypothetical protein